MKYYKTFNSNEAQDVSFEQVIDTIRNDQELQKRTQMYRDLTAQGQEKAAKEVKESTPQVAVSFLMEGGKGKDCCRECLYQVLIDFDAKGPKDRLPADELERVKTVMRTSYHARLGYESISGLGYHVVVPFLLPEDIDIDMQADAKRAEEIYQRAYRHIANQYAVWCGHQMDRECKNVNRMMGLSHDPQAVYRPDARQIRLTREELGIDKDGHLVKMKTPKQAVDKQGNAVSVHLGDHLERAVRMVEDADMAFAPGNRHNFVMRVSFILNRMGVDQDEAAEAVDREWLGQMDGRPSDVLHSCYKTASDEFGMWLPQGTTLKTELIKSFLGTKTLQYDLLTQKTRQLTKDGQWCELKDRDENDLYIECCAETDTYITEKLFHTVLNSSVVPEVNPLREYVMALPQWNDGMPDYIQQTAAMVHMATPDEQQMWHQCFRKWFVAMVAGWTDDSIVNHQVIVFVGPQGIFKTSWINRLLPPQLTAYTTDNVDIRAPFGRHKEKRTRVASYAASGNKQEFLTDQTGNRRWLPFHVVSIDSPYTHLMPYEGMYAQALHLLQSGFNYWFDLADIHQLEAHVETFMVPQSEEDIIAVHFSPAQAEDADSVFLTLGEISAKIVTYGNLKKTPDNRTLGAIMTKLGFLKERRGRVCRRGYYVREHTQAEIDKIRHPEIF